ncbi:hypothetical protein PsYK624_123450 [Phanerochaete sordida]|uniref:Uncharacterized protein n=1 Tax=Phanerochaete sordida TaxID=48140 RepID=A0A9P3GJ75_9APHY|nr:hypothetical protein PsYK624_123450 [Phanerochaete sordida]
MRRLNRLWRGVLPVPSCVGRTLSSRCIQPATCSTASALLPVVEKRKPGPGRAVAGGMIDACATKPLAPILVHAARLCAVRTFTLYLGNQYWLPSKTGCQSRSAL